MARNRAESTRTWIVVLAIARCSIHPRRLGRVAHSDPKLTARTYSHLEVEDLRGAVERLHAS